VAGVDGFVFMAAVSITCRTGHRPAAFSSILVLLLHGPSAQAAIRFHDLFDVTGRSTEKSNSMEAS